MAADAGQPGRIVVVGASVGGVAACEALRSEGFDGEIVIVGAEAHKPYDRPPLSKQFLLGTKNADDILLREDAEFNSLELDLRLGRTATSLDVAQRAVTLDDGEVLHGLAVIVATGSAPIRLPAQPLDPPFFELRTLDDAVALRDAIRNAQRLVIVGAGFIGLEVAAAARASGCDVTILEAADHPLSRVVGSEVAAPLTALHADHGVDVRCNTPVLGLRVARSGAAEITLGDGAVIEADAAVVGIGAAPAVGWLAGSGLDIRGGVRCDAHLLAAPGVWAIGDAACWRHPLFGVIRVEHWATAREHARTAAAGVLAMLHGTGDAPAASAVPYFWSDQFDVKIHMVGWPLGADRIETVVEESRHLNRFFRDDRQVAAFSWNWPRQIALERRAIGHGGQLEAR